MFVRTAHMCVLWQKQESSMEDSKQQFGDVAARWKGDSLMRQIFHTS